MIFFPVIFFCREELT